MNVPFYKQSRFWTAVATALLTVANEGLGWNIPPAVVMPFVALVITYILGDSFVEAAKVSLKAAQANLQAAQLYASIRK